ncbi:MAG: phosphate signaling complex protein PhoU [Halanaerobiales bacterium]|nr:phosphate signaling complex protein PhoU [Halanaerobiales bacterium]HPZ62118.1 phosphate signaling complex protein PhoU [Halanaerobiales bacterium]HQD03385.1 phosphate signaling complex protein PhoU [Halanaerobiales bacterium]
MRASYHESLLELKNDVLKMASLVEDAIIKSVKALQNGDLELAEKIIKDDGKIDEMELTLEDKCTRLIALQQPVARDLRLIIAISKLLTDLERIGDHATNIADIVLEIGGEPLIKPLIDIQRMTELATKRLRQSIDSFVNLDIELAKTVARADDELDIIEQQIIRELFTYVLEDPRTIRQVTQLILVARSLERIGDHSTNICERVIYMVSGERQKY